jgi:translation initiation factor 3 subunit M
VNIICHLLPRIAPASAATASAAALAAALAAVPTPRPERRLQSLVNLYNVAWEPAAKTAVLMQALSFAGAAGLADAMLPVVRQHGDAWARDLGLGAAQERELYVAAAAALRGCTRKPRTAAREAYRLLAKCLTTYEGAGAAEAAAAAPVAAQVAAEFVRSPDMFQFDHAANPAVLALAGSPEHGQLHALLAVFLGGGVPEFQAFAAAHPGAVEAAGLTQEAALEKMRLLALVGLACDSRELTFAQVAASLALPESGVEAVVVAAIGKRLLEARIDQLAGRVAVSKCAPRTFGGEQWATLRRQLGGWRGAVAAVRELGADEKSVLPRGIEQLSVGC